MISAFNEMDTVVVVNIYYIGSNLSPEIDVPNTEQFNIFFILHYNSCASVSCKNVCYCAEPCGCR